MTNQSNTANIPIQVNVMADGNIDMHHLSRAVLGALEYYRIGEQRGVDATPDEVEVGKAVINSAMQAFGLECALKGLHQALGMNFPKTHDLVNLFDGLPAANQAEIQARWAEWDLTPEPQAMTFRKFVEEHAGDFVAWRYLEGNRLENAPLGMLAAIMAVNAVTRDSS